MKHIIRTCFFLLLSIMTSLCYGQNPKEGYINLRRTLLKANTDSSDMVFTTKIWYRDSLVVEEVAMTHIKTLNNDPPVIWTSLLHYVFIDLRKGLVYKYKTFTDTSMLVNIYPVTDSGRRTRDALIYTFLPLTEPYKTMEDSSKDTLIDGTSYKRDIYWKDYKTDKGIVFYKQIALRRCDLKGSLFSLPTGKGRIDGCPVVKKIVYSKGGTIPITTEEDIYLTDSLTTSQHHVFDIWEQMADCNATVPQLPYVTPYPKPFHSIINQKVMRIKTDGQKKVDGRLL